MWAVEFVLVHSNDARTFEWTRVQSGDEEGVGFVPTFEKVEDAQEFARLVEVGVLAYTVGPNDPESAFCQVIEVDDVPD